MIKMYNRKNTYEGFSLVEMLITIAIIGVVMLISSVTLTSLIKVSTVSSNKTRVRNDTEFILELVRRTVRNSNPSDVYIFNSHDARTYNPQTGAIEDNPLVDIDAIYANGLGANIDGTEIQFRPYGYKNWICIGFFESSEEDGLGYILKTSAQDLWDDHRTCFEQTTEYSKYTILLNSDYVDIKDFNIAYTQTANSNYLIRFDIEAEPTNWYLGPDAPVLKTVHRQTVVSTEGLIW